LFPSHFAAAAVVDVVVVDVVDVAGVVVVFLQLDFPSHLGQCSCSGEQKC
jgi:hypothetical protein